MNLPMWAAAALSYTYPLFDIAGRSIIEAATRRRTKQNRFAVWILASLAVAGASLISIKDFNGPAPVFYSVLYPLGFAALWALFANMSSLDTSKQLSQSPLSERIRFSLTKVGIMLGLSGVINVIVLALCQQSQLIVLADFFRCTISGHSESMSQGVVLSIIGLISISTAIPYALFSWTMQEESTVKGKRRKINPTMALVLQSIETLTAVAVAMIIAHESPLPHQILGLTFIIAADTALIKKL
jgi:drug/metabolite transporter (DMT)-like permease